MILGIMSSLFFLGTQSTRNLYLPTFAFQKKISHSRAYFRRELQNKRMGNKNPNGNIIVDGSGGYNQYDGGAHKRIFDKVRQEYVIGDPARSRLLSEIEISLLAPHFVVFLKSLFGGNGSRPFDFISIYGRKLSESQVHAVLEWIARR